MWLGNPLKQITRLPVHVISQTFSRIYSKEGEEPEGFLSRAEDQWTDKTGINPKGQEVMFRQAVMARFSSDVKAKVDGVPGLMNMS